MLALYTITVHSVVVDVVFLVVAGKKQQFVDTSTRGARAQHCYIRVTRRVRSDLRT